MLADNRNRLCEQDIGHKFLRSPWQVLYFKIVNLDKLKRFPPVERSGCTLTRPVVILRNGS